MPGVEVIVQEIPSIIFIRSLRTIIQTICENLADYRIGKVEQRDQVFSDGTGRRQTDIHNLIIGVINEELLCPLTLSISMILEGDMSEKQIDAVQSTIVGWGKRLQRWEEVLEN